MGANEDATNSFSDHDYCFVVHSKLVEPLEPCDYLEVKVDYDDREGFTVGYLMKT